MLQDGFDLALTGSLNAGLDDGRRFAQPFLAELLEIDERYFDMDVDAVQQRAGDALLVAGDHAVSASAFPHRGAEMAARAGVHRRDEYVVFINGTGFLYF